LLECLGSELELLFASACAASQRSFDLLVRYGIRPPAELVAPEFLPFDTQRREADSSDPHPPIAVARGPDGAGSRTEPKR
jgi:hypothetical protein